MEDTRNFKNYRVKSQTFDYAYPHANTRRRISSRTRKRIKTIRDFFKRVIVIQIPTSTTVFQNSNVDKTQLLNTQGMGNFDHLAPANVNKQTQALHTKHPPENTYKSCESHINVCSDCAYNNFDVSARRRKQPKKSHEAATGCHLSSENEHIPHPTSSLHEHLNRNRHKQHCHYDTNVYSALNQEKSSFTEPRYHKHYKSKQERRRKRECNVDTTVLQEILERSRRYTPQPMFDKTVSVFSQMSAPICRDQDVLSPNDQVAGPDLCSNRFRHKRHSRHTLCRHDSTGIRSLCDTSLHSNEKSSRHKRSFYDYNDTSIYDVIPVKEKSSPQSKKKLTDTTTNDTIPFQHIEIPPCSKTLIPRLNLKAQLSSKTSSNSYTQIKNHKPFRETSPAKLNRIENWTRQRYYDTNNDSTNNIITPQTSKPQEQNIETNNSEYTFNDSDKLSSDKTEYALCEIRNMLQSFLSEIKRGVVPLESNVSAQTEERKSCKQKASMNKISSSFGTNRKVPCRSFRMPSPYHLPLQPFNSCCYPAILPVCPMIQSYVASGPSFGFQTNAAQNISQPCSKSRSKQNINSCNNTITTNETEQMIKEIYKLIAQKCSKTDDDSSRPNTKQDKIISKSQSPTSTKSCETFFDSKLADLIYQNQSYSETALDKLSLEEVHSSQTVFGDNPNEVNYHRHKNQQSKFFRILSKIGLVKNKKDVKEELSNSTNKNIKMKNYPYSSRDITANTLQPKSIFAHPSSYYNMLKETHGCSPKWNHYYQQKRTDEINGKPYTILPEELAKKDKPNCPQSHVSLCFKEIEVKNTGTQCTKKAPFLHRFVKMLSIDSKH